MLEMGAAVPGFGVGQSRKPVDQRVNLLAELERVGGLAQVGEGRLPDRVKGGGGAQAVERRLRRVVRPGQRTVGTLLNVLRAHDRVEEKGLSFLWKGRERERVRPGTISFQ